MTPMAMRSPMAGSIQNVEDVAAPLFLARRGQQGANCARGAALAPDDFAEVGGSDLQLDDGGLVALVGANSHGVGIVDERFRDELDQLLHLLLLALFEQRLHGGGKLRAFAHPVVDALAVDLHISRIFLRIVMSDLLHRRRPRRPQRVGNDDPVERSVRRSSPAQTNLQHSSTPNALPNTNSTGGNFTTEAQRTQRRLCVLCASVVIHCRNSGGSPFIIFPKRRAPNPFENERIIFFIARYCFSRRLISCTDVPEPLAILFFRDPLMICGNSRSFWVIESRMACMRTMAFSSI